MQSGAMMPRRLGEQDAAERLDRAIASVIVEGTDVTYDLKPTRDELTAVDTRQLGEAVIRALKAPARMTSWT